ncbi:MAG: glycosyltransferase [Clostridia bacterium]|nr:glycosyltransferase [Clostridia bacterium]
MSNKLNVCLLNDSFPPSIDGVATAVLNYAAIIQSKYGSATVVTPKYPDFEDDYTYNVVRFPSLNFEKSLGYRAGMPFDSKVLHQLAEMDFDILHCHCPFASAYVARALREATGLPLVFTYHTKFDYDIQRLIKSKPLQNTIIKFLLNNVQASDEVWVVSDGAGKNLRSLGYEGDYIIMENGVDLPKEKVSRERTDKISEKHGIPAGVPVYLFVGRLVWYKGLKIILDGLAKAKENERDFRMIFVGGGDDADEVKEYAHKIGLDEKCIFTGAISDRETLRDYYGRSDLFLFPSVFDTNGLAVREAAACGTASVLIKDSCAGEGITDGRNGFLIEENSEALADVIIKHGGDRELLGRIGDHAMEDLYYSWDESVAKAVERYAIVKDNFSKGIGSRVNLKMDKLFETVVDIMRQIDKVQGIDTLKK